MTARVVVVGMRLVAAVLALLLSLLGLAGPAASAEQPAPPRDIAFTAEDGVALRTTLTTAGNGPRPTVVEFSPYGDDSGSMPPPAGFNSLLVQLRGTGDSTGSFDAMGPRTQRDIVEVLEWACRQPWSNGELALNGFSASAIIVYNSLHQELPCVRAAVLRSGTFELYRDLLVPGGISNIAPGAGVLLLIGAPALLQGGDRLDDPASSLGVLGGLFLSGLQGGLLHPTLDAWWRVRGFRGNVNDIPTLVIDGWFDVESRGGFQGYQELREDGAHLLVVGAHDGAPTGNDGGVADAHAWLAHFVDGVDNGAEGRPRVRMLLASGDREDMLAGDFVEHHAADWPVPGTTWEALHLDPARSGTAYSLNDGSLSLDVPGRTATQSYPAAPSLPTNSDPPNTAILGGFGLNQLTTALPVLSDMTLAESVGLTYTTAPLREDVLAAGPLNLELPLSSTATETNIWAVLSDVSPDGTAHPLTVGRLSSAFPRIVEEASLHDAAGAVVQPYGDYGAKRPALPLTTRRYQVELWPVGNRFEAGHRIRVQVLGSSAASLLSLPGLNSIRVGGPAGAVLRFPVLPGSDLRRALGD